MTTIEKVAYIKGLMDGMKIDESSDNGKLMKLIVDILGDLSNDVADIEDYVAELTEQVDAVDEDLNALEEDFYEEWDDEDECGCCDCCDCDDDYGVTCPFCNEEFDIDEDSLMDGVQNGGIECPYCGQLIPLDEAEDEE